MFYFVLLWVRFLKKCFTNNNCTKHFTKLIEIKIKGNISCPALNGLWNVTCFSSPFFCSQYSNIFFYLPSSISVQHLTSPSAPATCIVCSLPLSHTASFCVFPTYTIFICQTNFLTFLFCPITALLRKSFISSLLPNEWELNSLTWLSLSSSMHSVSGCSCPLWK